MSRIRLVNLVIGLDGDRAQQPYHNTAKANVAKYSLSKDIIIHQRKHITFEVSAIQPQKLYHNTAQENVAKYSPQQI